MPPPHCQAEPARPRHAAAAAIFLRRHCRRFRQLHYAYAERHAALFSPPRLSLRDERRAAISSRRIFASQLYAASASDFQPSDAIFDAASPPAASPEPPPRLSRP